MEAHASSPEPPETEAAPSPRAKSKIGPGALVAAAVLVALVWQLPVLYLPPHGDHAWRDADGLGIARSFLHEGLTLLTPRVVERGALTGIAGMELPLVNACSAVLMKWFGEYDGIARLPVWLCILPFVLGVRALGRRWLRSELAAAVAASFAVLHPLVLFLSHKLMPELPMLTLVTWGLVLAFDGLEAADADAKRSAQSLLAGVCFALAAVLKPTAVAVAVPLGAWFLRSLRQAGERRAQLKVWLRGALIALPPLVAVPLWFHHANALDARYGLPLFHLHQDWFEWIHLLGNRTFVAVVFGRLLHLQLLWSTVAVMAWRWRALVATVRAEKVLVAWFAASFLFLLTLGSHNFQHYYYALPLVLPCALLVASFLQRATQTTREPFRWAAAFVALTAVTALVRSVSYFAPITFDVGLLNSALPHVENRGLAVVTDRRTVVVSLVLLHQTGWTFAPEQLTPARIAELKREGARTLIESSFGGWLPDSTRRALPPPFYVDAQVRAYAL